MAEEVAEVLPELVIRDENGEPFALRWHLMHALLVNELQKQQETIERLTERLVDLEAPSTAEAE